MRLQDHSRFCRLALFGLFLLLQCLSPSFAMMIKREIKNPDFDFSLSDPKCKFSPDPHRVKGASYYLIECSSDVSEVELTFSGVKTVYDIKGNQLSSLSSYPLAGETSTQYVKTCDDPSIQDSCATIQIDVTRSNEDAPLLSRNGITFTNYAVVPPSFDPKVLTYDVQLYAREPTTVAVRAAPGYMVDFENGFAEKGFISRSDFKVFTPQGDEGETESFQVFVTNSDRSLITTYTINVKSVKSINPRLSQVDVYPGRLDPMFRSHKYSYLYRVPEGTSEVTLDVKAVNERDTRCFVQPIGLGRDQGEGHSSIGLQKTFNSIKSWSFGSSTSDSQRPLPEPIPLGASGRFSMKLRSPLQSTDIVIDCVAADDTYKVRYVFGVVKQLGGSTLLQALSVPHIPFDQSFDPRKSGPYSANIAAEDVDNDQSKWINFLVVPYNPRAICTVEGKEVNAQTHLSPYFRIFPGEKRQFRVTVRTPENAVPEEYFVIIDRPAPWYKSSRITSRIADLVGLTSSSVAATRGINFINNAKFLHFISLTNRLNGNPETYDTYSGRLNRWNLEFDFPDQVYMVNRFQNQSSHALSSQNRRFETGDFSAVSTSVMNSPESRWTISDWDAIVKEAASRFQMYEAPVQKIRSDVAADAEWKSVHPNTDMYESVTSRVLSDMMKHKIEEAEQFGTADLLHAQSPHRLLLPEDVENQHDIVMQLDAEYKNLQKLLNYCSSIMITTVALLVIGAIYALVWTLYLRDVRLGWTSLRQDFPAVLKPTRFWTFLFDYALISYLQSCCGILFTAADRDAAIRLFGMTVTANGMAWFAGMMLIIFPVAFLAISCGILFKIRHSLLFSKQIQCYHDDRCEELKASQRFFSWIPILSNLFTVEITSVAPVTRFQTDADGTSDGPIHFSEEVRTDAPFMVGNPKKVVASGRDPMDVEAGSRSTGYASLLKDDSHIEYREKQDTMKVTLSSDAFDKRLDIVNPTLYSRYPNALVGYSKYKVRNAYDHLINVQVEVQLRHLTSLMNLQSYAFWVPRSNLEQDEVDNWNLLFGKSQKGNLLYWVFDRCITAGMIVFLTSWSDRRGIAHTLVFAFVSLLVAGVYIPSAIATATSKWFRVMSLELEEKKYEQHTHALEEKRFKVWPFRRSGVKEQFQAMRERKRDFEMWGTYSIIRKYIAGPMKRFNNMEFWKTRCWLTVRECVVGPVCSDLLKFFTLFTIFMGNFSVGIYSNAFASITCMALTVVALVCLNTEGLKDWCQQLRLMLREVRYLTRRALIMTVDFLSEPRFIARKFAHFMNSCQRVLQGERGVAFGYPGYAGETVRDFKVDEVIIINNEIGVHLPGKIEHSVKTKHEMKYSDCMERGRFGSHKTLHVNGSIGVHRGTLDRAMPIQMPFRQFFHLGKGKDVSNVMTRLAATIQIVNYNESRAASGHGHTSDDDSFFSLYTDPALMSEYGKIRMKHQGHGYVVRYMPEKQTIYIRGPGIRGDVEYSITSLASKPEMEDCDAPSTPSSVSTLEAVGNRRGDATAEVSCDASGRLVVPVRIGEVPDLHLPIEVTRSTGESFEVDPSEIKVDYHEYKVGRSQRHEMTIRSRMLIADANPYTVTWAIKTEGKKINATAKSPATGVLFVPWTDETAPDLHSYITLRDETEGSRTSGSVIDIDPRDTDAHQFILPPVKYNGMSRIVASISSGVTQFVNTVMGRNPANDDLDEPIPCTIVQCTNPIERQYRVEPNFAEAVKGLTAKIEQLMGMKRDLDVPGRLGYIWSDFMSTNEFIRYWETMGVNIVIRGQWINPITNSHHVYMKENQQRVTDGQIKFRAEISRRIEARIGILSARRDRYKIWDRAYMDADLYSYQLSRESAEWGLGQESTLSKSLQSQIQKLQLVKSQYDSSLTDFQYPMTVDDRLICRREKFDAQLKVWREELTAWLSQCEGASFLDSYLAEQGGKSCGQATIDDAMRAVEHSIRKTEHAQSGIYRTVLHYVASSVSVRGHDTNWKPDPLAAHYCMVRLFPGDKDDVSKVEWNRECWHPCYLKLAGNKVIMLFPHEFDAKAETPEFYEDDITKRWSWNQIQAYYVPLECFEKMMLTFDPSIAQDPKASDDVRRMHAKLVMKKNTEIHVDDRYVKSLFKNDFADEFFYGPDSQVFKIRLGNTVSNNDQSQYSLDDSYLHGDRCTVLPLTFRFHHSYFNRWQSAIRLAQMNSPPKEIGDFDGHVDGDGYSVEDSLSDYQEHIPSPLPPISSESEELSDDSYSQTVSESIFHSESVSVVSIPQIDVAEYKGEFRDYRFSGTNGRLVDHNKRVVYEGDWVEGQRWGKGRCIFKDHQGVEWQFEGDFIADEMRRGKLSLIDEKEIQRLRQSSDSADRYSVVAYEGEFALPSAVRGVVKGQAKKRDYTRLGSNCGVRGKPNISPLFLQNLFETADAIDSDQIRDKECVIDIRRAISACAYDGKQFDRKDSLGSQNSEITIDAQNAFEEYLPHRSRWTRLINPNAGYRTLLDRFVDGEVIFADGCRYRGALPNGIPGGRGVLTCPKCPIIYNGYWRKGRPDGYGMLTVGEPESPERVEYYGNFKEGKREGRGVQLGKNGKVIIKGEFKDDVLHGKSCSVDLADDVMTQFAGTYKRFIGGVEESMPSGKGKLEWQDGPTYKGDFSQGKRHGQGTMKDKSNRTVLTGNWDRDLPDGRVVAMVLPDGKVYTGDVKQGQRQGMGELFKNGVAFYEGLWMNDLPHGRGALYATDGDYDGEFKGGKRHGKGRFEFKSNPLSNGKPRVYEGDWKNDRPDGTGRYVNELGIENTYKFKDGELLPSSVKVYKSGMCGKAPTMGVTFKVEPCAVTGHDPIFWGLKRRVDAEKIRVLHRIGMGEWEKHEQKKFVYMDPMNSPVMFDASDDLPRAPVKQKSLDSLASSSDPSKILEIRVIEGKNLPNMDIGKKMDPYCKVIVGRRMKKTKPINGAGSNPKWNATLKFEKSGADWVNFEVWDKDTLTRDDLVGHAEYSLASFFKSGENIRDEEIPLSRLVKGVSTPSGSIKVSFAITKNRFFTDKSESQSQANLPTNSSANVTIPLGTTFVEIKAHSAKNLYNTELLGKMDPYLKYYLGNNKVQTEFKKNGGTTCTLDFISTMPYNSEPSLRFEVWDHDTLSQDDLVGYGSINLSTFTSGSVDIFRDDKKKGKILAGEVSLTVSIVRAGI